MRLITLFCLIVFANAMSAQSEFARGYNDGFKKGFCQEQYSCTPPAVTPPTPNSGYRTYSDGYARGVEDGAERRKSPNKTSEAIEAGYRSARTGQYTARSEAVQQNASKPREGTFIDLEQSRRSFEAIAAAQTPLNRRSSPVYSPHPRRKIKPLKGLKVQVLSDFDSLSIAMNTEGWSEQDPMFIGSKLGQAFAEHAVKVNDAAPYKASFSYSFRSDSGCGGVVLSQLSLIISDKNSSEILATASFTQSPFSGKCIDDVLYQLVNTMMQTPLNK